MIFSVPLTQAAGWLALSPHSNPAGRALSVRSLHVLGFSPGTLVSSHSPETCMLNRLIGDFKLPGGVNMKGCLSLCVRPVMSWRLVHDVPMNVSWDWTIYTINYHHDNLVMKPQCLLHYQ